jgi:adenylyl- and sulfurtransferase ThiI
LKEAKLCEQDADKQVLVDYKRLMHRVTPVQKNTQSIVKMAAAATMIQKVFRGYIQRKKFAEFGANLINTGENIKDVASKKLDASKAKKASDDKDKSEAKKKVLTKEELKAEQAKKKEAHAKQ